MRAARASSQFMSSAIALAIALPAGAQTINEDLKIAAADSAAGDQFGVSAGVSGGKAIVGAHLDDDNGAESGSAYLFDAATGQQLAKLLPLDGAPQDNFGWSVAIHGDVAIVGAPLDDDSGADSGAAYLFDAATGQQLAKLLPLDGASQDNFGWSVAIHGDVAIVGAYRDDDNGAASGSAYLFDVTTGQQIAKLLPTDGAANTQFGWSVAVHTDTAIVGAFRDAENGSNAGAAYLFDVATGQQTAKLLPNDAEPFDNFGVSVAVSADTALIGSFRDSNPNGSGAGSAYLFDVATAQQTAKLLPNAGADSAEFGWAVAFSGDRAVITAWRAGDNGALSGAAYLFDLATNQQTARLLPTDGAAGDRFGSAIAISGATVIAGARLDSDAGASSGSAYIFHLPCPGDINGDNIVDFTDLNILLSSFGDAGPGLPADLNGDGFVNFTDLNILLAAFGTNCLD